MLYCIDPSVEEPIMLINKHIGYDEIEGQGVDGSLFQAELLALDAMGKKRIQVWINSPGGVVMDGYNIYSTILHTKTKVDTYCVGIAASISAVIFQAGRVRTIADYGLLMYHNPYGGDDKTQLEKMTQSIAVMIAKRAGKTEDEVKKMMAKTSWITASEAFSGGLADEILASNEVNKKRSIAISEPKAMYLVGNDILNSILPNKTQIKTMNKVTNKLGLIEGSNEEAILNAIAAIENKAATKAAKLSEMEAELKAKMDECDKLKAEIATFKKKAEEAEAAEAKAKADAVDVANKATIENFVKAGKIKNESVNEWVETAKTIGIEKVTNMLNSLPVFKQGNKINVSGVDNESLLTSVVARTMQETRNKLEKQN